MGKRSPVKQQHERSVVADFISWLNARRGTRYSVVEEPDPPEAIIQSVRVTTWVEVVDAFWTGAYAQDLYSFATPGELHKPIGPGPHVGMDICFAKSFVKALSNKLKKTSYLPFLKKYGPGYLVVPIQHPWFDGRTVREMTDFWSCGRPWPDKGCFKEVYIACPSLNRRAFRKWKV
jgi:hypothetical protein